MEQDLVEKVLAAISEAGGLESVDHSTVAGAHMLQQTTRSELVFLNGKIVERAERASR